MVTTERGGDRTKVSRDTLVSDASDLWGVSTPSTKRARRIEREGHPSLIAEALASRIGLQSAERVVAALSLDEQVQFLTDYSTPTARNKAAAALRPKVPRTLAGRAPGGRAVERD